VPGTELNPSGEISAQQAFIFFSAAKPLLASAAGAAAAGYQLPIAFSSFD
jgi:hypothetical protein